MAAKKTKKAARPREGSANRSLRQSGIPEPWEYAWDTGLGLSGALVDPLPRVGWQLEEHPDESPPTISVPIQTSSGLWVPIRVPDVSSVFAIEALLDRRGFSAAHLVIAAASWFVANLRDPVLDDRSILWHINLLRLAAPLIDCELEDGSCHAQVRDLLFPKLWRSSRALGEAAGGPTAWSAAVDITAINLADHALWFAGVRRQEAPAKQAEKRFISDRSAARLIDRERLIAECAGPSRGAPRIRRSGQPSHDEQCVIDVLLALPSGSDGISTKELMTRALGRVLEGKKQPAGFDYRFLERLEALPLADGRRVVRAGTANKLKWRIQ